MGSPSSSACFSSRCQPRGRTTSVASWLFKLVPFALRTCVFQGPADRLHAVELAGNHVCPGRRERILEIRHEDLGPGIERVDHHLPLHRSGDLHPPIVQVRRCGRHLPAALADLPSLFQEVRQLAPSEASLDLPPTLEQRLATRPEMPGQQLDKSQRLRGDDLARFGKLRRANL